MNELSRSARAVQEALDSHGVVCEVKELPSTTRSAKDAARSIGCTVQEIAKSIVFRGTSSGQPVLVIASGTNRISEQWVGTAVGEPIEVATADFVRQATGFAIGGVPPLGHRTAIRTYIDEDLLKLPIVWAAAGTPFAVFAIPPATLVELTTGTLIRVTP
ncbi:MAG: YbaK/EbsC family protein [Gammaproteobacteria bacterium]